MDEIQGKISGKINEFQSAHDSIDTEKGKFKWFYLAGSWTQQVWNSEVRSLRMREIWDSVSVRVKIGAHKYVAPSEIIVLKSYMLYASIYGFWKRQKYRNGEHISGWQGLEERGSEY